MSPVKTKKGNREKIGTVLDKEVAQMLRERAAKEGRTMSDIIQEAVVKYAAQDEVKIANQVKALERFLANPGKLSREEIDEILAEDYYDQ